MAKPCGLLGYFRYIFHWKLKLIITISFRCDFTHTHLAPGGETSVFLIPTSDSPVIEPVEQKGTSAMRTNLSSGFRTGNRLGFTVYKRTSPAFIQSAFVLPAFVQGDAPAWSECFAVESGFCVIDVHAVSLLIRFIFFSTSPIILLWYSVFYSLTRRFAFFIDF